MNHLILLHILITFLLLSTLSACGSGSTNGRQTGRQVSITGAAQKGDFIKDSQISFARFFRSGASSTERLDSSILNNKGEYAVSLTWNDWTKITTTGVFYNEFLGEESTVALTLNSITDIGGSSEAFKINFFTHFAAARIEYLINQGQTLSSASQQALSEIKTSFSLSGNSIDTIDLNQDSHSDNAILLLFSASFLAVNQQNMFATSLEILTLDFADNGLFDGASKALFQKISNYAGKKNVFFPLYNNLRKRGYTNPPNQNTIKISPSWINNNPSVSIEGAELGKIIIFGESVTLRGTGVDTDGQINNYLWTEGNITKGADSELKLSSLSVGEHYLTLTVTDNEGASSYTSVKITVNSNNNKAPIVSAGPDQSINFGQSVSLNGSAHDTDGSISSWVWKEGKVIKANGKSSVIPSIKINKLSVGLHEFTLSATDNKNSTSTDYVRVLVNPVPVTNTPPIVKAGPDQSISFGQSVSLNGSAHDTDGSISSWVWKEGKIIKASGKSSVIPSLKINKLSIGLHEFTLSATDNKNATSTDKMEITVKGSGNKQLTAKAGTDRTITELQAITLTGEGNVSDGSITSYTWKEGAIKLSKTQKLSLKNLTPGTHHLTLVVTDNSEATASDNVTITVTALRVNLVGQKACTTRAFFGSTYHIGANYTLSGGKNGSGIAKLNQYSDASCTKNPSHFFNFAQSAPANYFIQSISASGTSGRMSVTSQGQTSTRSIVVANGNVTKIN